jgi:hypothetical protein
LGSRSKRRRKAPFLFCSYAQGVSRPLRIATLGLLAGLFALAVYSDFPLCPMASSLGIPCPGCGLTRATLALLHGDVGTALHFHPLVTVLAPLFITFVGTAAFDLVRDPAQPRRRSRIAWNGRAMNIIAATLFVLTVGVWLARFAGYFGGPVPVTSMRDWLASVRH